MISEKEFATHFSGFWSECLPFLTPELVAAYNLDATPLKTKGRKWMKPLPVPSDSSNNDWIAETAFGIFAEAKRTRRSVLTVSHDLGLLERISESALERLLFLPGVWAKSRVNLTSPKNQAIELATRLETYFWRKGVAHDLTFQPHFKGCGIVDSCYGDILGGNCLYELKTVDRNLRSADLRQVLVYCALNRYSVEYAIDTFTILNARRGLEYVFEIEKFSEQVSGKTAAELFHEMVHFLSSYEALQTAS